MTQSGGALAGFWHRLTRSGGLLCLLGPLAVGCARHGFSEAKSEARVVDTQVPGASTEPLTLTRAEAQQALCQLYASRDLDCDRRITVLDEQARCGSSACTREEVVRLGSHTLTIGSLHQASQLATELAEELLSAAERVVVRPERVLLDPASYLKLRIEQRYWRALTRVADPGSAALLDVLRDEKQGANAASGPSWCTERVPRCARGPEPVDASGAAPASADPASSAQLYLYVPEADPTARKMYANVAAQKLDGLGRVRVDSVKAPVTVEWVRELTRRSAHGLLTLAYDEAHHALPFVVPGGRFNEMYGWDSYFIALGLLQSSTDVADASERVFLANLAQAMVEHQSYELRYYGKVLNANRTYYLLRSQPPLYAPLLNKVGIGLGKRWADIHVEAALREYAEVWASAPRRSELCEGDVCLARYLGEASGPPPEVEKGHFAGTYQAHAVQHRHCSPPGPSDAERLVFLDCVGRMVEAYAHGQADAELDAFFTHDSCVRESGHDTTFRWFVDGQERCADHVTVDLNALLFRYELELAELLKAKGDERAAVWCERARARARLVERYLWNEDKGFFFDYDFVRARQSSYVAATTLYPLWASTPSHCDVSLVTPRQAQRVVANAVALLEAPGGLMATAPTSLQTVTPPAVLVRTDAGLHFERESRQWEAPNGWAPHQMVAWEGLRQHGFGVVAARLAYRWLHMLASNAANYHGTVPEKFDVVRRSHRVFAEYGNVNTEFAYIAQEGFGWMNASFVVGWQQLTEAERNSLRRLEPPPPVPSAGKLHQ